MFFPDTLCFKETLTALLNVPDLFSHEDFNQLFVVSGYSKLCPWVLHSGIQPSLDGKYLEGENVWSCSSVGTEPS